MKRMFTVLFIIVAGLLLVGLSVLCHAIRTAPIMPPESDLPVRPTARVKPIVQLQSGVKLEAISFHPDTERSRQLREKLWYEELRQRPQEQRN